MNTNFAVYTITGMNTDSDRLELVPFNLETLSTIQFESIGNKDIRHNPEEESYDYKIQTNDQQISANKLKQQNQEKESIDYKIETNDQNLSSDGLSQVNKEFDKINKIDKSDTSFDNNSATSELKNIEQTSNNDRLIDIRKKFKQIKQYLPEVESLIIKKFQTFIKNIPKNITSILFNTNTEEIYINSETIEIEIFLRLLFEQNIKNLSIVYREESRVVLDFIKKSFNHSFIKKYLGKGELYMCFKHNFTLHVLFVYLHTVYKLDTTLLEA